MSSQGADPPATLVMRLRHATGASVLASREMLSQVPQEEQEDYVVYREQNREGLLYDPLQSNPEYTAIFAEVAPQAQAEAEAWKEQQISDLWERGTENLEFVLDRMVVHVYWASMKRILKERYNLDWKTPAEMSPHRHF